MNASCRKLRQRAAREGVEAIHASSAAAAHLADCDGCRRAVDALAAVDDALAALPPHDAPDAVVDSLLARVADAPANAADPVGDGTGKMVAFPTRKTWLRPALATAAVGLLALSMALFMRRAEQAEVTFSEAESGPAESGPAEIDSLEFPSSIPAEPVGGDRTRDVESADSGFTEALKKENARSGTHRDAGAFRGRGQRAPSRSESSAKAKPAPQAMVGDDVNGDEQELRARRQNREDAAAANVSENRAVDALEGELGALEASQVEDEITVTAESPLLDERKVAKGTTVSQIELEEIPTARDPWAIVTETPGVLSDRVNVGGNASGQNAPRTVEEFDFDPFAHIQTPAGSPADAARTFLESRDRVEGIAFQPATGYWSNTYVPGDPVIRLAMTRLEAAGTTPAARLATSVRAPAPLFDPPRKAAMALDLSSDRDGVEGPTRTLVQVGLRATDRDRGRRPALDVALVLDLVSEVDGETVARLRALLEASLAAAEPGDRFSVAFAGRDVEGIVPEAFRHGAVMVALDDALRAPTHTFGSPVASAVSRAVAALTARGEGALGASSIIVISARPAPETGLEGAAHAGALEGVGLSVVLLGDAVDRAAHSAVALAGQGSLRQLVEPSEAASLIARELAAASRIVARALRLNIRLAPDVELVDVIGAERLDARRTARAKAAEAAIDRQVADSLGIRADRGDDDAGIQILIPAFHAGDHHVILLDVVAPGPGRIADASLVYKDLVRARNGKTQARLKLRRIESRGPDAGVVAHRVRRNLLAQHVNQVFEAASADLASFELEAARSRLAGIENLIAGLRAASPVWRADADLGRDLETVRAYRALLPPDVETAVVSRVVDSLRVAAARMLHPSPDLP